jgi:hypothetical protein
MSCSAAGDWLFLFFSMAANLRLQDVVARKESVLTQLLKVRELGTLAEIQALRRRLGAERIMKRTHHFTLTTLLRLLDLA